MSERLEKLVKIKNLGINPYPEKFERTHKNVDALKFAKEKGVRETNDVLENPNNAIKLCGRMMTFRSHGKLSFAQMQDVSGRIQLCFVKNKTIVSGLKKESVENDEVKNSQKDIAQESNKANSKVQVGDFESAIQEEVSAYKFIEKLLDLGDFIGVNGELFKTNHGEITLFVSELTFLGKALRDLPEKFHGVTDQETIYRQRYLDLLMNAETQKRFKNRSEIVKFLRHYLESEDFMEVETQILTNKASGAAAKPFITHHNAFDLDVFLRIAPETYLKRCVVGGMERVFEFARCFRNEGIDPSHLQDFTMLEFYRAYANYQDLMDMTEDMLKKMLQEVFGTLILRIPDREGNLQEVDFSGGWSRKNLREMILEDSGIDIEKFPTADELRTEIKAKGIEVDNLDNLARGNMIDGLYKKTSRQKLIKPIFVTSHPLDLSPLARTNAENSITVDRFQLVINTWEVVNAYSELVDPVDQKERFLQQEKAREGGDDEAVMMDEDYVKAMEYGMPPIAGWGMGIDRIVALFTGQTNIKDCVLFPLMKPLHENNVSTELVENKKLDKYVEINLPAREEAWKLVEKYVEEKSYQHLQMVEVAMRTLAKKFEQDENLWGIVGLLHDIDWDVLPEGATTHDAEKMYEILKEIDLDDLLIDAIISHDPSQGIEADDLLKKSIRSVDEITGFISAVTKVRPDKKMESVKVKSVIKKIKDKSFAANVSREHLKYCEELLDIPVAEFVQILLTGLKPRAGEFGL